ncbi:MAG: triose-phosphate isomerase [Thermoplasmata archaeon]|nr:triose-phosphate isomerase [Thermoplasmata archaeon]
MGTSTPSAPGPSARRPLPFTDAAPLGLPLFILNLKAYGERLGAGATEIGLTFERRLAAAGIAGAVAPAAPDLGVLAHALRLPVLAQHTDPLEAGARTGYLLPEAIAAVGGRGSLVNHSEHPLGPDTIAATVQRLDALDLVAVVCARDVPQSRLLARFHPKYLAVEPPELIGGPLSVSTARPEVISGTVAAVLETSPRTHILCGAGIHDRQDVRRAFELGAEGILVSSAVARAEDPSGAIDELLAGFPRF